MDPLDFFYRDPDAPVAAARGDARIRHDGAGLPARHLGRGVLTGRGADIIIIDDPLKPEEALSQAQRQAANDWYDHTLYSRLNDKLSGAIVLIMHRLHEGDLVGHVLAQEAWEIVRFPGIAEDDETQIVDTVLGPQHFTRRRGEALHPEREPLAVLEHIRRTIGEYNFAGQPHPSRSPRAEAGVAGGARPRQSRSFDHNAGFGAQGEVRPHGSIARTDATSVDSRRYRSRPATPWLTISSAVVLPSKTWIDQQRPSSWI